MMKTLTTFAALSMAGTVMLSLLPEGSLKRTAGMVIGLLTLMCWAEGVAGLLGIEMDVSVPPTVLTPTSISLRQAESAAAASLAAQWEASP